MHELKTTEPRDPLTPARTPARAPGTGSPELAFRDQKETMLAGRGRSEHATRAGCAGYENQTRRGQRPRTTGPRAGCAGGAGSREGGGDVCHRVTI